MATASGLRTTPSILVLPAGQDHAEMIVSNIGASALSARVQLFDWSQRDGQEKLSPTREMAVSPRVFQLLPHQQQRVRVLRLNARPDRREASYRLIIEQLPDLSHQGPQTVLRYSAPVFALPAVPTAPELRASLVRQPHWQLRVDNLGNAHARLADIGYLDAQGQRSAVAEQLAGYVLAGQYLLLPLPERATGYAAGQFVGRINQDPGEQALEWADADSNGEFAVGP